MRKALLLASVIAALGTTSVALAGPKMSIVGGGNYGLTSVDFVPAAGVTGSIKGGIGYQGGLLFEFGMKPGIEIGAFYNHSALKTTMTVLGNATESTNSSNNLVAPVSLRFYLGPSVSLGLGGYFSYAMDSGVTDKSSYGAQGGLRFGFGELFLEPGFMMALKSTTIGGVSKNLMSASVNLGYTFGKGK